MISTEQEKLHTILLGPKMKRFCILVLCSLLIPLSFYAHGGEDHKKKKKTHVESAEVFGDSVPQAVESIEHHHQGPEETGLVHADLSDFPSLHPLIVHFPIVLLLLAALSQLAGFFVYREALNWVTLFLLAGGFVGAWIAGTWVHPHTHGLSNTAAEVLELHEGWAAWTFWTSLTALLVKGTNQFILRQNLIAEFVIAVMLFVSAGFVSLTGHYGAQLVHIEGVGAQGDFLEEGSSDDDTVSSDGEDHDHH